jgi:hypothetical protein
MLTLSGFYNHRKKGGEGSARTARLPRKAISANYHETRQSLNGSSIRISARVSRFSFLYLKSEKFPDARRAVTNFSFAFFSGFIFTATIASPPVDYLAGLLPRQQIISIVNEEKEECVGDKFYYWKIIAERASEPASGGEVSLPLRALARSPMPST